ncbi:hypothetical protein [Tsukamurella sp. 1534]|uniref:hypothetical protein n=1 Tax=Tsukamurella sp. 1534 TaxID=1151061 RepID=UPI0011D27BDD|nr:hypothetical protein [Tsukamurella sp. 1534]
MTSYTENLTDVAKVGKGFAGAGNALTVINTGVDVATGAPVPETLGKGVGSIAGRGSVAWLGAGLGMAVGGPPPGELIGAGIGALAGSKGGEWIGGKLGSAARGLGRGLKSIFS